METRNPGSPVFPEIFLFFHLETLSLSMAQAPGSTALNCAVFSVPAPVADTGTIVTGPVHLAPRIAGPHLAESPLPAFIADTVVVLTAAVLATIDGAEG